MSKKGVFRSCVIALAVVAAIAIPAVQMGLHLGLSAAEFAAQGDRTLRAAPYAFTIWGLIYAGLIMFTLYQFRGSVRSSALLDAVGWPAAAGIFGCGLWILASACNLQWVTMGVIVISALSLIVGLGRARALAPRSRRLDLYLVIWPLAFLAGWLTIASGVNIVTVLTAQAVIQSTLPAALATLVVVFAVASGVGWRLGTPIYLVPVVWGLTGVTVAERSEHPVAAWAAAIAALVLALQAIALGVGRGRSRSA